MSDVQHIECTTEEYHAMEGVWSNSQVKLIPKKVRLFYGQHITKEFPYKPKRSQRLGDAVHRILLDKTPVMVIPDEVLTRKRAKAGNAWKEFEAEYGKDHVLVKPGDEWDDAIRHMVASVRGEPMAMKLLEARGKSEYTLVYQDEATGLRLRARLDRICEFTEGLVIPDVKTTKDPLPGDQHFGREMAKFDYHRQGAWYWDGVSLWRPDEPIIAFALIAVRNKAPFECVVHELAEEAIKLGRRENRAALDELKRRLDSGDWNLTTHGHAVETDLPEWRYRKEN